jgi:hypothetical protein
MKKLSFGNCLLLATVASCGLVSCGGTSSVNSVGKNLIAAPTDFTMDADGNYSFVSNDENAAYYYIRGYDYDSTTDKTASFYRTGSDRIDGSKTGKIDGKMDMSGFGWGSFKIKLITYASAGSIYTAPDPIVKTANFGKGGTMETPEWFYNFVASTNTLSLHVDAGTLFDYYFHQTLSTSLTFDFASDAAFATIVKSVDFAIGTTSWTAPWFHSPTSSYGWLQTDDTCDVADLAQGTYYVRAKTKSPSSNINASEYSQTLTLTLAGADIGSTGRNATYVGTDHIGTNPSYGPAGRFCATDSNKNDGAYFDSSIRGNYWGTQTVTNEII